MFVFPCFHIRCQVQLQACQIFTLFLLLLQRRRSCCGGVLGTHSSSRDSCDGRHTARQPCQISSEPSRIQVEVHQDVEGCRCRKYLKYSKSELFPFLCVFINPLKYLGAQYGQYYSPVLVLKGDHVVGNVVLDTPEQ